MTITAIETVTAADMGQQDAAETQPITRADIKGNDIRLFDGRKKVGTIEISLPATPERVEGFLAGAQFPTTRIEFDAAFEEAMAEVEERRSGTVIPDAYRHQYGVDQNCGDDVAVVLKDFCGGGLKDPLDIAKLQEVADINGIGGRLDVWLVKGLNNGMLRMNTGNVLRGMVRNEKPVRVGGKFWNREAFIGPMQPAQPEA